MAGRHVIQRTRLIRPVLSTGFVERDRLHRLRDAALATPLTIVVAPAGYGKSTLVTGWLTATDTTAAWLTIDATDRDPSRFLHHLVAAIEAAAPSLARTVWPLIEAGVAPADLGRYIASESLALPRPLPLVLDDVHLVADTPGIEVLAGLVEHPSPMLRILALSRFAPSAIIARARAKGIVLEVGPADLRFDRDEIARFMQRATGVVPDTAALDRLVTHTEGWAVCLRLAAIAAGPSPEPDAFMAGFTDSGSRALMAYLADEILAPLAPDTVDILLASSVLERITLDLLCALTPQYAPERVAAVLDLVVAASVYLSRLDDAAGWYRLHGVVREILQERLVRSLGADGRATLHRRASRWFADHRGYDQAIVHALAAGDHAAAVAVAIAAGEVAFGEERWNDIPPLLRLLDDDLIAGNPDLLFLQSLAALGEGSFDVAVRAIERGVALLDAGFISDPAHERALRARFAFHTATSRIDFLRDDGLVDRFAALLDEVAPDDIHVRDYLVQALIVALASRGRADEAIAVVQPLIADADRSPLSASRANIFLAFLHMFVTMDIVAAGRASRRSNEIARHHQFPLGIVVSEMYLGMVALSGLDLEIARRRFRTVVDLPRIHVQQWQCSIRGLALCAALAGDHAAAASYANRSLEMATSLGHLDQIEFARSFRARIHLLAGEQAPAIAMIESVGWKPDQDIPFFIDTIDTTRARILIASNAPHHLAAARLQLDDSLRVARRGHQRRLEHWLLAIDALYQQAIGDFDAAAAVLGPVLDAATTSGTIALVVELGEPMRQLITRLVLDGAERPSFREALGWFDRLPVAASGRPPADMPALSPREREILEMLGGLLPAKEIGHVLGISPLTVKRHLRNIYAKLDVSSSREAIDRARAMGLLAPAANPHHH